LFSTTIVAWCQGWTPSAIAKLNMCGRRSGRAAWAHFSIVYPTPLGLGTDLCNVPFRVPSTSLSFIGSHSYSGRGSGSVHGMASGEKGRNVCGISPFCPLASRPDCRCQSGGQGMCSSAALSCMPPNAIHHLCWWHHVEQCVPIRVSWQLWFVEAS